MPRTKKGAAEERAAKTKEERAAKTTGASEVRFK